MSDGSAMCWGVVNNEFTSDPVSFLDIIPTEIFTDKQLQVIQVAGGQPGSSDSAYYMCALLLDQNSSEYHIVNSLNLRTGGQKYNP
eukprot:3020456-Rhodomonas_salina.1